MAAKRMKRVDEEAWAVVDGRHRIVRARLGSLLIGGRQATIPVFRSRGERLAPVRIVEVAPKKPKGRVG